MYKTHILVGIFLAILALTFFEFKQPIFFILAVLFGSLFVDIDENNSYIGRRTWPLSWFIKHNFGHRGIFHSLLMAGLIGFGLNYFLGLEIAFGFALGYVGHLLADGITLGGVKIFYPFSDYHIKGFIPVGGVLEKVFFVILASITVYFGYNLVF